MKSTEQQGFIASVHDDYLSQIEQVAERLRTKGCKIEQVLKLTGVITGKIKKDANLIDLQVEGIASVEKQRTVRKR